MGDMDDEWEPWQTPIESTHELTGTIMETGELAVFTARTRTWARTEAEAVKASKVIFDFLIAEEGIDLQEQ